jgi:hypothetical protein
LEQSNEFSGLDGKWPQWVKDIGQIIADVAEAITGSISIEVEYGAGIAAGVNIIKVKMDVGLSVYNSMILDAYGFEEGGWRVTGMGSVSGTGAFSGFGIGLG